MASNEKTRKARQRQQLFEIADNQGWKCYWCGWPIDELTATRDHLVPKSKRGSNRRANIVATCCPCNQKRGASDAPPPGYLAARRLNLPKSEKVTRPRSKQVRQILGDVAQPPESLLGPDVDAKMESRRKAVRLHQTAIAIGART